MVSCFCVPIFNAFCPKTNFPKMSTIFFRQSMGAQMVVLHILIDPLGTKKKQITIKKRQQL
jgi:hypothetical protein